LILTKYNGYVEIREKERKKPNNLYDCRRIRMRNPTLGSVPAGNITVLMLV
jgi:hypothetical protein